jgi:hypothetical protein
MLPVVLDGDSTELASVTTFARDTLSATITVPSSAPMGVHALHVVVATSRRVEPLPVVKRVHHH